MSKEQWKFVLDECCTPSAEDLALIESGDYCAEELWGGPRPTCPKCIDRSAPAAKGEGDYLASCEAAAKVLKP